MFDKTLALVAAVGVASLAPTVNARGTETHSDAIACEAAAQHVRETVARLSDKPLVILGLSGPQDGQRYSIHDFQRGWRKDRPSRKLIKAYLESERRDPIALCTNLRRYLDDHHIVHDEAEVEKLKTPESFRMGEFPMSIFSLAMPVVSADGREALVEDGLSGGPRAGAGSVRHLRKGTDGTWRVTDVMMTWIA